MAFPRAFSQVLEMLRPISLAFSWISGLILIVTSFPFTVFAPLYQQVTTVGFLLEELFLNIMQLQDANDINSSDITQNVHALG